MELLGHFDIAPGQFMPNSWRIVVNCMGIWLAAMDRDMIKVDGLIYLYRLKECRVVTQKKPQFIAVTTVRFFNRSVRNIPRKICCNFDDTVVW